MLGEFIEHRILLEVFINSCHKQLMALKDSFILIFGVCLTLFTRETWLMCSNQESQEIKYLGIFGNLYLSSA